ncbi:MAG: MFS transporter [Firmicutes bacterium]|nr:MFS transporter [Bacillota bacterium]
MDRVGFTEQTAATLERVPRLWNYIAYGMGDFLGGGSFNLIGTMYLFFMTSVMGMAPVFAGLLVFLGKLWGAIFDPLMGYLSDRTRSRHGRRRIFFLYGMLPVLIFFSALWIPSPFHGQWGMFFWYLVLFLLFSTTYTMIMVPYVALNAEISLDYKVRARFTGFKQISAGFSSAVCLIAAKPIIELFPQEQTGYAVMGLAYGLFFALPWLAIFYGTWELPRKLDEVKRQSFGEILANFYSVFKNRSFRIHVGIFVSAFAGMDFVMALFLFYLTYYAGREDLFPFLMIFFVAAQAVSLPVYIKIGNVYSKGRALFVGTVVWLTGLLVVLTVSPDRLSLPLLVLGTILLGSGICGGTTMPWVMLPSIADVDELITGQKRAGTYAGMMTLFRKIVSASVIFITGAVLSAIGFVEGAASQPPQTVAFLRILFFAAPFIAVSIALFMSLKFKITPQNHQMLRNEIDRLEKGGDREECDAETRRICEMVTGIPYRDLYRS